MAPKPTKQAAPPKPPKQAAPPKPTKQAAPPKPTKQAAPPKATQRAPVPRVAIPLILEAAETFNKLDYDPIKALVDHAEIHEEMANELFKNAKEVPEETEEDRLRRFNMVHGALVRLASAEEIHRLLLNYGYCKRVSKTEGEAIPGGGAGGTVINVVMDTSAPRKG